MFSGVSCARMTVTTVVGAIGPIARKIIPAACVSRLPAEDLQHIKLAVWLGWHFGNKPQ